VTAPVPGETGPKLRVAIAEDSGLVRAGLVGVLRELGFEVTIEVSNAADLVAAIAVDPPQVAIVDIRMPPTFTTEGLEAAAAIRASTGGRTGVLVLSNYVDLGYALRLVEGRGGGAGYLLKDRVADITELGEAVRRVAAGGTVIDPAVVAELVGRHRAPDPLAGLTGRELEVLGLMAEGRSNQAIADRLVVTLKTVETHIASILSKLGLELEPDAHRRVLAVLAYLRRG
jgi:DNA-binding NarL/FixJ family response regulator